MRIRMSGRNCLLSLMIMICSWSGYAFARVWYVRNDGTGDVPTIQAAIDSAAAGDTITLAKGIFTGQSIIRCYSKTNLFINSEAGPDSTILSLSEAPAFMSVANCTLLSVDGITFRDSQSRAISFYMSSQIAISNCGFFNNGNSAILFDWCHGIDVHDSNISGNAAGISYYEMDSDVVMRNNTLLANAGVAIDLMNGVINCSITHSIIEGSSYGIIGFAFNLFLGCNDVFNNGENYAILDYPDPTGLDGNISVDPQFCSIDPVAYNNYYLQSDSPCAPGNHPCGLIGCELVGCETTASETASWSTIKQLFK